MYGTTPDLLRPGLLDPRLRLLLEPRPDPEGDEPLDGVMQE